MKIDKQKISNDLSQNGKATIMLENGVQCDFLNTKSKTNIKLLLDGKKIGSFKFNSVDEAVEQIEKWMKIVCGLMCRHFLFQIEDCSNKKIISQKAMFVTFATPNQNGITAFGRGGTNSFSERLFDLWDFEAQELIDKKVVSHVNELPNGLPSIHYIRLIDNY